MDVPALMEMFVSYGFETDDEMTDEQKLLALNETYWDACTREDWPFLEVTDTLVVNTTTGAVTALGGADIGVIQAIWQPSTFRTLQPIRLDDLNQRTPSWRTDWSGQPVAYYYFVGDNVYLAPFPTTDPGDLNIAFTRVPDELTAVSAESAIVLPKRFHRSVLGIGTLSRLALMQDDVDMSNAYERLYEKALALMVEDVFKRQSDRPDYVHVNDPDNWDYS